MSKAVAVLLAGPFLHRAPNVSPVSIDFPGELAEHILAPLSARFACALVVAAEPNETAVWLHAFDDARAAAAGLEAVVVRERAITVALNASRFDHRICRHPYCESRYYAQYAHLRAAYDALIEWERSAQPQPRVRDFLVKARIDLVYRPGHVLKPEWLERLPNKKLCVPASEANRNNWWNERPHAGRLRVWPYHVNDQILGGHRGAMNTYFGLLTFRNGLRRHLGAAYREDAEAVLADYLARSGLSVQTVLMQYVLPYVRRQPCAPPGCADGVNISWEALDGKPPCRACWT